ncbi:MAG: hypothetical protein ACRC62_30025 [Microcoleus sp.]
MHPIENNILQVRMFTIGQLLQNLAIDSQLSIASGDARTTIINCFYGFKISRSSAPLKLSVNCKLNSTSNAASSLIKSFLAEHLLN